MSRTIRVTAYLTYQGNGRRDFSFNSVEAHDGYRPRVRDTKASLQNKYEDKYPSSCKQMDYPKIKLPLPVLCWSKLDSHFTGTEAQARKHLVNFDDWKLYNTIVNRGYYRFMHVTDRCSYQGPLEDAVIDLKLKAWQVDRVVNGTTRRVRKWLKI